jgi:putative transposase
VLGIKVAASTVWQILNDAGIDPANKRTSNTWSTFLRSQTDALLDRTLIWNQRHLLHAYEKFYNSHRPHQGIANARPLHPLPQLTTDQARVAQLTIRRCQRLGGILNEYHHAA